MDGAFGAAAPILYVDDLRAALAYYVEALGFSLDWDGGGMVSVSRDRCTILLTEWRQSQPRMWVWIGAPDVTVLHDELVGRGARVRHPPTNYYWALEMQIEDLDGNVLRIGSDPVRGEPFGDFLDADGMRWNTPPGRPSVESP